MSNYVFECKSGKYGFFRIDDNADKYYVLINDNFLNSFNLYEGRISKHLNYENKASESLSWLLSTDPTTRLLSIILWHQSMENREIKQIFQNNHPGSYYIRSIRGLIYIPKGSSTVIYNESAKFDEIRSYQSIYTSLLKIFDFIEPETPNLLTYSNKIREVLILGCTEVEYLLKKTLEDNNYQGNGRLSTKDYIKVLPFLKLDMYSVKLKMFPDLGAFSPFVDWTKCQPTKSLKWYDSYNEVKHDRGNNKSKATLEMLINSIAAIHILLEAQYGAHIFDSPMRSRFESIFHTVKYPSWNIQEIPMPILGMNQAWTKAIQVPF